jgi:hypothetical protein
MGKEEIRFGLRSMTSMITKQLGHDAVYVPRRKTEKCMWHTKKKSYVKLPFEMLLDVIEFALEQAYISAKP